MCVPFIIPGTKGGTSWISLLCAIIGGLVTGLSYYIAILITVDPSVLQLAAPQWPVIIVARISGLFGFILNSILEETLVYSGNINVLFLYIDYVASF